MKLLLIGATGSPYFEHCKQEMISFLSAARRVGLVPAASLFDEEAYFRALDERITRDPQPITRELIHIRWNSNWREALNRIDAVIIPGGNTYALLKRLYHSGLVDVLRQKIKDGLPYIGSSAGANITGPNILTTNDWNVVGLTQFKSLALVPFNINPHYVERDVSDAPHSETRDTRIREYHQVWRNPVVGIQETTVLKVQDGSVSVRKNSAKIFYQGGRHQWVEAGNKFILEHAPEDEPLHVPQRSPA